MVDQLSRFLDKPANCKHISAVKKWGNERWRAIGRALGYTDQDISNITSPIEREGDREKLHHIMDKWMLKHGEKATLRKLLKACRKPEVDIRGQVATEINAQIMKDVKRQRKRQRSRRH